MTTPITAKRKRELIELIAQAHDDDRICRGSFERDGLVCPMMALGILVNGPVENLRRDSYTQLFHEIEDRTGVDVAKINSFIHAWDDYDSERDGDSGAYLLMLLRRFFA